MPEKRLLFIDPGSQKSGWALFEGKTLVSSGHINTKASLPVWQRLAHISRYYISQFRFRKIDGVHLESIVRSRFPSTRVLFWSVGVIGTSLSEFHSVVDDINPRSWQAYCKWKKGKVAKGSPLEPFLKEGQTEDEQAAIGQGVYYTQKKAS